MIPSPLARACVALRLPRGLYCYNARADVPLSDAEIRLALRQQHVSAERLVLALATTIGDIQQFNSQWPDAPAEADNVWELARAAAQWQNLPASMIGVLALAAMLPEEGAIEPDEWGFFCEAAP